MTSSAQEIQETSNHYRLRVSQSQRDFKDIEQLQSMSQTLANTQPNQNLADPACYHRAHGAADILRRSQPGSFDHWARHYIQALNEPSFYHFHHTLEKLALQTADPDGRHSDQNMATFTAAAIHLLDLAIGVENDESTDSLISFVLGLIRSAPIGTYRPTALAQIIATAFQKAVEELLALTIKPPKYQSFHLLEVDDLGRAQYRTATLTSLNRTNRLADIAVDLALISQDNTELAKLREITTKNLDDWTLQSVTDCAFDAISTNHVHHMAKPLKLPHQTIQNLTNIAREIFDRHQHTDEPKAPWLKEFTAGHNPKALDESAQTELCQSLDKLVRQYNAWYDETTNFDDYGRPHDSDFRRLDGLHAEQNALNSGIIIAASRITSAAMLDRRDAIIIATAGDINWQSRQEFQAYAKHASGTEQNRSQALQRLNDAYAIIAAMPTNIVSDAHKHIIMNHDEERRQNICNIIK